MTEPLPSEAEIAAVVDFFYKRVRADAILGPVFNAAVTDWPAHLESLKAFWSSVMLASGRYKGDPMAAHLPHAGAMTDAAFSRWLALWRTTTDELLAPGPAVAMQARAERIAQSLSLAMAHQTGPRRDGTRPDRRMVKSQ